jgi:hypothetical protein
MPSLQQKRLQASVGLSAHKSLLRRPQGNAALTHRGTEIGHEDFQGRQKSYQSGIAGLVDMPEDMM